MNPNLLYYLSSLMGGYFTPYNMGGGTFVPQTSQNNVIPKNYPANGGISFGQSGISSSGNNTGVGSGVQNNSNSAPLSTSLSSSSNVNPSVTNDPVKYALTDQGQQVSANKTPTYSQYDPRYFQNQVNGVNNTNYTSNNGGTSMSAIIGEQQTNPNAGNFDYVNYAYAQKLIDPNFDVSGYIQKQNALAISNNQQRYDTLHPTPPPSTAGNVNTNTASPGAINALTNQPNLKNRQPSLAAGWGSWDSNSNNVNGNANFAYYSRFQ